MALDWNGVLEKVVVTLIAAAVVGVLALLWNYWGSQGGLVHVLGGVTSKEVDDLVKKLAVPGPVNLPNGAVVAYDLPNGCPVGWVVADSAIGRAIVGAATHQQTPGNLYTHEGYADDGYGNFALDLGKPGKGIPAPLAEPDTPGSKTKLGTEYGYAPLAFGTNASMPPAVLALWYCKRGTE